MNHFIPTALTSIAPLTIRSVRPYGMQILAAVARGFRPRIAHLPVGEYPDQPMPSFRVMGLYRGARKDKVVYPETKMRAKWAGRFPKV